MALKIKVRRAAIKEVKAVKAAEVAAEVAMTGEEVEQYIEAMQNEQVEKDRKTLCSHMKRYYCVNQRRAGQDRSRLRLRMSNCEADRALTWSPVLEKYHQAVGDFGTKWIRDN